jgi:hypothetical protein
MLQRNSYKLGVPFQVLLLKIVVTCVDIKYETYQADICGDSGMCVLSKKKLYSVRDVTIDSMSGNVACSSILKVYMLRLIKFEYFFSEGTF